MVDQSPAEAVASHVILPVEIWYSILARVTGDYIYHCLSDLEPTAGTGSDLSKYKAITTSTMLKHWTIRFTALLLVAKSFQITTEELLSVACGFKLTPQAEGCSSGCMRM